MSDIFAQIIKNVNKLEYTNLEQWVIPELMNFYDKNLNYFAKMAYGYNNSVSSIAIRAFKEKSKAELKSALETFLFKKEHWKNNRNLNSYLLSCFRRLSNRLYWDQHIIKSCSILICPACKYYGRKEKLVNESGVLRCNYCTNETERLSYELKKASSSKAAELQRDYKFHALFSSHSVKGFKCPECLCFIPESLNINGKLICPYPRCIFIGGVDDLTIMNHPRASTARSTLSMNKIISKPNHSVVEFQDIFESDNIDPSFYINIKEQFDNEFKIISQVINEQIKTIKRQNNSSTIRQKLLMYQAYQNMLLMHPEDMVSYLARVKRDSNFPLQAKIFQEYAFLIENSLPFTIKKGGKKINIMSLTDPNLALFKGISEFESKINSDYIILNNTKEEYVGGRLFKNYGKCFIGKIIDIKYKKNDKSIKNEIKDYSFVQIQMKNFVEAGESVVVKHFRILPHYEMNSMVFLQRIRRQIVDSVYFRINKKKREVRSDR